MAKLTKILTILACTFALSMTIGCGKDGASGGGDDGPAGKLVELADKVCECEDLECAKEAGKEGKEVMKALKKEMKEKYEKESDIPKDVIKAVEEAEKKATECAKKLMKKAKGK